MPNEPLPGKEPLAQRRSTTTGKDPRRSGSVRTGTPVLEPAARGSDENARAAGPGGDPGFRSAIFRARSEASDGHGPAGRPVASPLRPRPERETPGPADEDDRWAHKSQANEIRWLNTKIEELERRLYRRKIVSVGAIALGGLALIAAVAFGIASSQPPDSVVADIETTSSGEAPGAPAPAAGEPDQASKAAPLQAELTPTPAETAVGEAVRDRPWRDEEVSEIRPSPTEPAPTGAAAAADEAGREAQTPPLSAPADTTAPAEAPGQDAAPWQLEAERALMALVEPGAASGAPGSEQAMEIPDLLSIRGRFEADPERSPEGVAEEPEPYAATASVNLREGPSTEAEVLTVVDEGDRVRRLGSEGDWLLVEYDNRGTGIVTGWVYGRFLRRAESPSQGGGPSARSG